MSAADISHPASWRLAQRLAAAAGVAVTVFIFLMLLSPEAVFSKELGVCEATAVRDVLAGHIVLPRFDPTVYVHTPPLYWWIAAITARSLGWNELALRLPSLIATALLAAVVFDWTAITISLSCALWSVAVLALGHFVLDAARQPRMDMMLALFVTAAILELERALNLETNRIRHSAAASLLMALAILTKGPLGLALPGLTIALFLLASRRFAQLLRPEIVASFAGALFLGLIWYLAAYRVGGDEFLQWQVMTGLVRRFVPTEVGGAGFCKHPFYYFGPRVITGALPWTAFLPAAAIAIWRSRPLSRPILFTICWFIAIVGFFSASTGKCLIYILPVFPPLAILIGYALATVDSNSSGGTIWFTLTSALVALAVGAIAAIALAMILNPTLNLPLQLHRSDREYLAILRGLLELHDTSVVLWIFSWFAAAVIMLTGIVWRDFTLKKIGAVIVAATGALFWFGVMSPRMAELETLRDFAPVVDGAVPASSTIAYVGDPDCDLVFYSVRAIDRISEVSFANGNAPEFVLFWQDRFDSLPESRRAALVIVARSRPVDSHGPRLLLKRRLIGGGKENRS